MAQASTCRHANATPGASQSAQYLMRVWQDRRSLPALRHHGQPHVRSSRSVVFLPMLATIAACLDAFPVVAGMHHQLAFDAGANREGRAFDDLVGPAMAMGASHNPLKSP